MRSENFQIVRDHTRCILCLECLRVCPQSQPGMQYPVIGEPKQPGEPPEILNMDNCIHCLNCYNTCRTMAITLQGYHHVETLVVDPYLVRLASRII